jgi:very-short-patch-repair endonuclease
LFFDTIAPWAVIIWFLVCCTHLAAYVLIKLIIEPNRPDITLTAMVNRATLGRSSGPPESEPERLLVQALNRRGCSFVCQETLLNSDDPKYRYRTDISLASLRHGLRIDVEVDGEFKNNDAEIRKKIEKRNQWFLGNGWHVLRIHSQMCVVSPERVADDILKYYEQMQCEHVFILADVLGERKWRILNKKFAKGLLR